MDRHQRRIVRKTGLIDKVMPDVPVPGVPRTYVVDPKRSGATGEVALRKMAEFMSDPRAPFWCGVSVGHWICGPLRHSKKTRRDVYVCISRCGVAATYEPWEIAGGKLPQTCYACRPGTRHAPSCHATVVEEVMVVINQFWEVGMGTAFEESVRVAGKLANSEWIGLARPVLADICDTAGYGRHFGWKVIVFDCAEKSNLKSDKSVVRVKAIHKERRQVEMMIRPARGTYEYQINLSTGRTDVDFWKIATKIKEVVEQKYPKETKKEDPVPAPNPVPDKKVEAASTNGHPARDPVTIIDVEKLKKLGSQFEKLIRVGADINEVASIKLVANEKLRQARERLEQTDADIGAGEAEEAQSTARWRRAVEVFEEFTRKAKNAAVDRDTERTALDGLRADLAAKKKEREALAQAVACADKEVEEAKALEADHMKSVGDQSALKDLIEALSRMG